MKPPCWAGWLLAGGATDGEVFVLVGLLLAVLLGRFANILPVGAVSMLFPRELMGCATSSVTFLGS